MYNNDTITTINDKWKIDSIKEHAQFYYTQEVEKLILDGKKNIVLGRKGTGKTALCNHILDMNNGQYFFASKISFLDFPTDDFKSRSSNSIYTIWKSIIYYNILKLYTYNKSLRSKHSGVIKQLFPETDLLEDTTSENFLKKLKTSYVKVDLRFLQIGYLTDNTKKASKIVNNQPNNHEYANYLESLVFSLCDHSQYYLLFDELDIDYQSVNDLKKGSDYREILWNLIRAVDYVNTKANEVEKKIIPIIFLRDDIYEKLQFNDKNKLKESLITIQWDATQLKKMLIDRLYKSNESIGKEEPVIMSSIFSNKLYYPEVIETILTLGRNRPRDIVMYIQACCELAFQSKKDFIDYEIMKKAEFKYSGELFQEFVDEIQPLFDFDECYDSLFTLLSRLSGEDKEYKDFVNEIETNPDLSMFKGYDCLYLIKKLYNNSIIGNVIYKERIPSYEFKYMNILNHFSDKNKFTLHPGLKYFITQSTSIVKGRKEKLKNNEYYG